MHPPSTFSSACAFSIRAREPTSAPPMMSLWPPSALLRLCMTRSAPSFSGRCTTGVAKVLSTKTAIPRSWAAAATAARSTISTMGLVGLSRTITRVRSPASEATLTRSGTGTTRPPNPNRGRTSRTKRAVPP